MQSGQRREASESEQGGMEVLTKQKKFSLVADSLHGSTSWQGREPEEKERIWVLQAYESGEIKKTLARFHPVPCDL